MHINVIAGSRDETRGTKGFTGGEIMLYFRRFTDEKYDLHLVVINRRIKVHSDKEN